MLRFYLELYLTYVTIIIEHNNIIILYCFKKWIVILYQFKTMKIQNTTYNKCELSIRQITFIHYAPVYINPKLTRSNGLTIAYERGNKWHYVVQPYSHTAFVDLWRSQLITYKTILTGISYFHHITVIRILARIWTTCGDGRTVWLGIVCHGGGVVVSGRTATTTRGP